jgi:site-specific recombinase XerD
LEIKQLQKVACPNAQGSDYIFRNHQTNTLVDRSTFSRYWKKVQELAGVSYPLHTFRAHRISQLILGGVEVELVARNLGLSVSQIMKTYLRFLPAARWEKLVAKDSDKDVELRSLMGYNELNK